MTGLIARALGGAALLAMAGSTYAQSVPLNDRRAVIAPGARTTEDPRRIPLKPQSVAGVPIVLTGGRLFDAVSMRVRAATVVIEGNQIAAVLPPQATNWPPNAQVIDVTGKTIMPGLIDMHVHVTYPDGNTPIDEQASEGAGVLRGMRNLRWMLESGITSVRDLNGVSNAPYLLAEASASDEIAAPRVFTAGHIITGTGGHATERPVSPSHGPDFAWERNGADAWRAAVRETFKQGASVIKVASHFAPDEIAAAVDEAHRLGLKVTCDCETIYTAMAVDAGIDMIEHPLPRTDATIAAMAKRGTTAVPTLQVYQNVIDRAGGFYGSTSRRFTMTAQGDFDVFKKMKAAGIVMGVGTDTIGDANRMVPNVYLAELKWFVKGGYSIPAALQAATLTNAKLLDMGDRLGSIEPGKLADVIVVDGHPDEDIDALSRIDMVVKDGVLAVSGGQVVTPRHVSAPLAKPSPPATVR
ncbi:amidohydrolase family protein [Sphingomonas sp. BK235]|uniref:amidohydrolase family protein n=1 Tax=Sphingomonas sp. BK235 TaxID=2512131 RepID=UPI0010496738|nr:amidohydrolase family protein [Sphingomonas sp. BK235]TCP30345.1 imidazolonepropionase-like amidohydrolase [Sphingomonas sp. BK235]